MPDGDGRYSRADLDSLIGIAEIQVMLSRDRPSTIARSYIDRVTNWPGFPAPLVVYPRHGGRKVRTRLWLPGDVEDWIRRTGWT